MKHLFIILFSLICSAGFAQETTTEIPLQNGGGGGGKEEIGPDNRSLVVTPTASHVGNVLYLSSEVCITDMQIIVKDATSNVIFSTVTTLFGQTIFTLPELSPGDYSIELLYGDRYLYGWFSIE